MRTIRKGIFQLEDEGPTYPGFTLGETWNGHACPYFTLETALTIANDLNAKFGQTGYQYVMFYNKDDDVFTEHDGGESTDSYRGDTLSYQGEYVRVYPIGHSAWTWVEVEPADEPNKIYGTCHNIGIYLIADALLRDAYAMRKEMGESDDGEDDVTVDIHDVLDVATVNLQENPDAVTELVIDAMRTLAQTSEMAAVVESGDANRDCGTFTDRVAALITAVDKLNLDAAPQAMLNLNVAWQKFDGACVALKVRS